MTGLLIDIQTGDLLIEDGSLVVGETSHQVVEHVLRAACGEYREQPLLGAEAAKMQGGITSRLWCAKAKQMCRAAGVEVSRITYDDDNTIIVQ